MGIAENPWIIDAVGNMVDKVMLAVIQICGLRDDMYNKDVTRKDGDDVIKAWGEIRRLIMKGKEDYRREEPTIPGCPIYQRRYQIKDGTDITTAKQTEDNEKRRADNEKKK